MESGRHYCFGDAHAASMGYIQFERDNRHLPEAKVINQITSSAMANIPPPGFVICQWKVFLQPSGRNRPHHRASVKISGTSRRIIGARNWLSSLDEQHCIWAQWKGRRIPHTKAIHPIGASLP